MPSGQFYAKQFSSWNVFAHLWVGRKRWGRCELARKAAPLLLTHRSVESEKRSMTSIFFFFSVWHYEIKGKGK